MSVAKWLEIFEAEKERERIEKENAEVLQEMQEHRRVTVGLRMDAYDAEMIKMFAQKYEESVSSIGSQLLGIAIREAIEGLGQDVGEWLSTAAKNLDERKKSEAK